MVDASVTALVVAIVGVAGTMGAPWLSQQAHRQDAKEQAERDRRIREEERCDQERKEKRDLYAALNSTARIYRSLERDVALLFQRGELVDQQVLASIDAAREAYRQQYAQAQMVLPQRPLQVIEEANRCLGHGYALVRHLALVDDPRRSADPALNWLRGPVSEAVLLLRDALREDLGVIDLIPNLGDRVAALAAARTSVGAESARD
ncbi:hypothetical protein OG453_44295 [Streptomyces sp. NBC_01381]|uniref:hypothetical protein n=1 Tax=Streptomyces sp. NBC_01381 TaxID=2903845 RepID=UPI00224FF391|nr:hypothetical protein [Streptomyces sp. NBC_01381]MCX4673579.1 hypothetical protein [Streptomyces sp. NBC_01381]